MDNSNNSPAMDDFRAGLTACLRSWSALNTAVMQGWGGTDSLAKAEDLRTNILEHFNGSFPPKTLTLEDFEDNLALYMEEEFSVVLEDGSERQVADVIWRMYEGCCRGDTSLVRQIMSSADAAAAIVAANPVQIQSSEHDDDEDDEEMDCDDDEPNAVQGDPVFAPLPEARQYGLQPLFGAPTKDRIATERPARQLGEVVPSVEPKEQFDEDGFAIVAPKSRRKGSKPM